jgi:hypothetical protein
MADTLGSLVDKLTIKEIREYHLGEMLLAGEKKFSPEELKNKLRVLKKQKAELFREIDGFVFLAIAGKVKIREDKLKLYNAPQDMGKILKSEEMGLTIAGLAKKNLELWHLEDLARRKDVDLAYIGGIKRKIDLANQQRNDFIDRIDELLEKIIQKQPARNRAK